MLLLLLHYPPNKSRRSVQSKLVPIVGTDILHVKYNSFFKWFLNTHWWFFLMRTKPTTAYRYMWSYCSINSVACRSQWPRGLRRGSAAAHLLGLWVRIPLEVCTSFSCECYVLSRICLCVGLITRPEESYRVWCVWVWSWSLNNEEDLVHWRLLHHGRGRGRIRLMI